MIPYTSALIIGRMLTGVMWGALTSVAPLFNVDNTSVS